MKTKIIIANKNDEKTLAATDDDANMPSGRTTLTDRRNALKKSGGGLDATGAEVKRENNPSIFIIFVVFVRSEFCEAEKEEFQKKSHNVCVLRSITKTLY